MKARDTFLQKLQTKLHKYPTGEVNDLLDYYDELISERVANGEKEADVIKQIGSTQEIVAKFRQEVAINRAVKQPTVSNSIKVLIAMLSVFSLPILIPLAALAFALVITALALLFSLLAVGVCGVVAVIASVVDMAMVVHAGDAPFYLLLLTIGAAFVVVAFAFEVARGLILLVRSATRSFALWLKMHRVNKKEER